MLTQPKIKCLVSIILAGFLLALALLGGNWGMSYTAEASTNADPFLASISPSRVAARSADKVIVAYGLNFGVITDTGFRLTDSDYDNILLPISVVPNGLSVRIDSALLTEPTVYTTTVVVSGREEGHTIPVLPLWPFDLQSNPLLFTVFEPDRMFMPLIQR